MAELANVADLVWDQKLYPRHRVSQQHVSELARAMEGGHELPPIVCDATTRRIADGVHRWNAALQLEVEQIATEFKAYENEAALWHDAVLLNSSHGLAMTTYDRLKVIEISREFGLRELDIAAMLRTSESYLRTILPRYATLADGPAERIGMRVPLKASTRHLSGLRITEQQARAIEGNAPGVPYLILVRQLVSALQHNLLPPEEQHAVLWEDLRKLQALLHEQPALAD